MIVIVADFGYHKCSVCHLIESLWIHITASYNNNRMIQLNGRHPNGLNHLLYQLTNTVHVCMYK